MIGDLYLVRDHGGPGWRGWLAGRLGDLIVAIAGGPPHVAVELDEGTILDAGFRGVRLLEGDPWQGERYDVAVVNRWLNVGARSRLLELGRSMIGKRYSWATFFAHLIGRRFAARVARLNPDDSICSELAGRLHRYADGYRFLRFRKAAAPRPIRPGALLPSDIAATARVRGGAWACTRLRVRGQELDPLTYQEA